MTETPPDKGRKEPLNLNFTFDYQDFRAYLAKTETKKDREYLEERLQIFDSVIDYFKKKYHCDNKEAFKQLKKKLEWAKQQQFIHKQKRSILSQILADQTKPYPNADASEQVIFPPLWEELISNYLWYCKRAKKAYKEGIVVPFGERIKETLVSQSQEKANQGADYENTAKENLILQPQEGNVDQEIYDEIRILEEKFNEGGGRDQELWTKIAELKSLL